MASKTKSNVGKKRKKEKITSKEFDNKDELSLQNVLDLGGDQADYDLLKDVTDEEDIETGELPYTTKEEFDETELKKIIKELGLKNLQVHTDISDADDTENKKTKSEQPKSEKPKSEKPKNEKPKQMKPHIGIKEVSTSNEVADVEFVDRLLIRPAARWYEESLIDSSSKNKQKLDKTFVDKMNKMAQSLLEHEASVYLNAKEKSKSSDIEWLKTMATSGTLGDKIASLAIQIQESPIHHVKILDLLLGMAAKKGRRECLMAIDTLKDLWLVNLLPNDRKLRSFAEFPLLEVPNKTNKDGKDSWNRKLILWCFEDQLKKRYEAFIKGMERLLHDNLENIRSKMLGIVYELLVEKPEQEKTLLLYLVNKVGDPNRKIASKAGYLLGCLVQKHPNMKLVITQEVERLLYRPNIALKAQYYAVCFLNQLVLTKNDSVLASQLITIYFSLFKAFVDKGQVQSKMLSGLLSGVNRAFYYVTDDEDRFSEQINMLFRVVHIAPFNTSVQALMLLFQVMDSRQSVSDRYYQALYTKLLDPQLRLSSKQAMFLNNIYKSLKVDPSLKRIKAFVKRLLQVCSTQLPPFICGVLYLLSEIGKVKPGIKGLVSQPEEMDEEEHFKDVIDTTEDPIVPVTTEDPIVPTEDPPTNHEDKIIDTKVHATGHVFINTSSQGYEYRANARNPLYCGADNSCLWEVIKLSKHYHPSVSHFAQTLLQGNDITYNGDPLMDFTLMRFLDRFVYKNPKKNIQEHGGSLMQPKSASTRLSEQPVNTAAFLSRDEDNIREDEVFFYHYFKQKAEQEKGMNRKEKVDVVDEQSDTGLLDDEDTIMDFAGEFEKSKSSKPKKKKRKAEDSDEEASDEEDFNYETMELSEDELDRMSDQENENHTDQDYEKVLLENLSSDEFSENESQNKTSSNKKRQNVGSSENSTMFAAAEEFAHLLDSSGGGGTDDIDMKGTSLKQQQWELSRMETSSRKSFQGNQSKKNFQTSRRGNNGGKRNTKGRTNRKRK